MIKEALQYVVGLSGPHIQDINGQTYSDKKLERVVHNPKANRIEMTTLTSLVEYIKANIDTMADKMIVHVVSPTRVELYSQLDFDREREFMVKVDAQLPEFSYGSYYDHEKFCIALQSMFNADDNRDLLLKFAGTVKAGTVAQYGDNGVSQSATIKKGVASVETALVPSPIKLRPYRTFHEVTQPESEFIFRMKQDGDGNVSCALFEADGGAWRNAAMDNVKRHLETELNDLPQFTVIS